MLEAKTARRSARNRSTRVVPISRLSADVLVQIFQLVTEGSCAAREQKETNTYALPKYPHLLTRVCSQWRNIVISATYLWSHIDIPCPFPSDKTTLNRMREYMARSGTSLLDVHIVELNNPKLVAGALTRVLAPLSPRIRSLELKLNSPLNRPPGPRSLPQIISYSTIFSACLSNCRPGVLEHLAIYGSESFIPSSFIAAAPSNPWRGSGATRQPVVSLSVTETVLEDLWLPITVLRLREYYPCWTSKAYQGLVELRLAATDTFYITQCELVKILQSSPQLRILDFGLSIAGPFLPSVPVRLEELETLVAEERTSDQLSGLLRLIAPGPRPLSVSLCQLHRPHQGPFDSEVQKFFARVNMGMLELRGSYTYPQAVELLRLIPDVRALALNQIRLMEIDWSKHEPTSAQSFFQDLYVLDGVIVAQSDLIRMIETHHIQRLVVAEGCVVTDARRKMIPLDQTLREHVSSLGLDLHFIPSGGPRLVPSWDWGS